MQQLTICLYTEKMAAPLAQRLEELLEMRPDDEVLQHYAAVVDNAERKATWWRLLGEGGTAANHDELAMLRQNMKALTDLMRRFGLKAEL